MPLLLKNPHSVLAALQARPADVTSVRLPTFDAGKVWEQIRNLVNRTRTTNSGGSGGRRKKNDSRSSFAEATVKGRPAVEVEELFSEEGANGTGLWLALDRIQDPHNVGAIFRTAAFFGIRGIVLTRSGSSPLNATVYDVASGGMEHVPFSIESNLGRCLQVAKDAGVWLLGASENADRDIAQVGRDRPWLAILGGEQQGVRRGILEECDEVCKIASRGGVSSLNVSVAAGILMSHLID